MMTPDYGPAGANRLEISLPAPPRPRQAYMPGESIDGEIILHRPYHADGVEASLTFTGVARVRFKDTGQIFSRSHTHAEELVSSHQAYLARKKHPDRLVWKFRLAIPSNVQSSLTNSTRFTDDKTFAELPGHALPPTFDPHASSQDVKYNLGLGEAGEAVVVYKLTATLEKPFFTHSYAGPRVCNLPLPVSPVRDIESQNTLPQIVSSLHAISPYNISANVLDNDNEHSHNLSWESMKPEIRVFISIPTHSIPGEMIAVQASFDHNIIQSAAEQLPPIVLKRFRVTAAPELHVRAHNNLRHEAKATWPLRSTYCNVDQSSIDVENLSCPLTASNGHQWVLNIPTPQDDATALIIPTFMTSNMALSYTLRVQMQLNLDMERIQVDVKTPLTVLPRYNRGTLTRLGDQSRRADLDADSPALRDPPPPYSEHQDNIPLPATTDQARLPSYDVTSHEKGAGAGP